MRADCTAASSRSIGRESRSRFSHSAIQSEQACENHHFEGKLPQGDRGSRIRRRDREGGHAFALVERHGPRGDHGHQAPEARCADSRGRGGPHHADRRRPRNRQSHIESSPLDSNKDPKTYVRVVDLLNKGLLFLASYPPKYYNRLEELKRRFDSYLFSTVVLLEAPINVATEVFERINTTGMTLEVFDIMVAKTFDTGRNFDLKEKYDALIKRLKRVKYDTIPPAVVLQTVSAIIAGNCDKKTILDLNKDVFIDTWPEAVNSIESAVDYFRDFYRIPVSSLLPYAAILIPFAYFFYRNKHKPVGDAQRYLQDFFWRTSLGSRYSSSLESRVGQDIKRVDDILAGKLPEYDYNVDYSPKFIRENGRFAVGRSYIKAILAIYAYQEPKSFDDKSIIHVDNNKLKQANSRNYHHFFPKAYLNKRIPGDFRINHIVNITIVDEWLNKRQIRDHAPSVYMKKFKDRNPQLKQTMETHLIDIDAFGIWDDDFDTFFDKRCQRISDELASRIIPRTVDKDQPISSPADTEANEIEEIASEDDEADDDLSSEAVAYL